MRKKLFGKKNPMFKDGRTKRGASCIDCGKHLTNWFTKRCNSCARKGKLNSQYKSGDTFCMDCGKKISHYSKRCKSCRGKIISGKGNPMFGVHRLGEASPGWKGGWKSKLAPCIDCGKKLNYKNTKRCRSCFKKFAFGKNSIGWKDGRPKCLGCGKQISYGHKRCKSCQGKSVRGKLSPHFGKPAPHGRWTKYHNIKFRSTWEANFAKWCYGSGIKWQYEAKAFDLGTTTYTPDFYLPAFDCYVEVKGYWRTDAKEKIDKFISLNPNINFKLFEQKDLQTYGIILR
jgi:hypothetical protein